MGTLTFTIQTNSTVGAVPPQNLTKTYTDTDANVVLALQAMQWTFGAASIAAGALTWTQAVVKQLINYTTNYQQQNSPTTIINPT